MRANSASGTFHVMTTADRGLDIIKQKDAKEKINAKS